MVNPLQSLAVGAIAYAGAFLMAIVAVVLSVVAIVVNGLGNPVDSALESVDMDQAEAGSGVASCCACPSSSSPWRPSGPSTSTAPSRA